MNTQYDAIALFSGGLDSILAVKALEEQNLKVKCLHFITPFFGKEDMIRHWQKTYALDIEPVDISHAFVHMMLSGPEHGFGKLLNPCVDCKILMMREAQKLMTHYGASCIVSGEVIGQRPMSQRRDTLNIIERQSGLKEHLLRPLSARLLKPSAAELSGLIDRERLYAISGRGRKDQLALAKKFAITEIPTPAGGCRLAEQENACRYWKVMQNIPHPEAGDFILAQTGRQYWANTATGQHWLCIGRNAASNESISKLAKPSDLIFRMRDFAGPLALGRQVYPWDTPMVQNAAAFVASFAPKAVRTQSHVCVLVRQGHSVQEVSVLPSREGTLFTEPTWQEAKEQVHIHRRMLQNTN